MALVDDIIRAIVVFFLGALGRLPSAARSVRRAVSRQITVAKIPGDYDIYVDMKSDTEVFPDIRDPGATLSVSSSLREAAGLLSDGSVFAEVVKIGV